MRKQLAFAAAMSFASTLAFASATDPKTPCMGTLATPYGLNPQGDNFLMVHAGPGGTTPIDMIFTDDVVCAFGRIGPWIHLQYSRDGRGITGWAHDQYLTAISDEEPTPPLPPTPNSAPMIRQHLQQKQIIINVYPEAE